MFRLSSFYLPSCAQRSLMKTFSDIGFSNSLPSLDKFSHERWACSVDWKPVLWLCDLGGRMLAFELWFPGLCGEDRDLEMIRKLQCLTQPRSLPSSRLSLIPSPCPQRPPSPGVWGCSGSWLWDWKVMLRSESIVNMSPHPPHPFLIYLQVFYQSLTGTQSCHYRHWRHWRVSKATDL